MRLAKPSLDVEMEDLLEEEVNSDEDQMHKPENGVVAKTLSKAIGRAIVGSWCLPKKIIIDLPAKQRPNNSGE